MLLTYLLNLKHVALTVPEVIGVSPKMGSPWICPCFLFCSKNLTGWTLWMYTGFQKRAPLWLLSQQC